ncbi:Histidine--tRNA ligase [Candidatus Desulfarcum epimagneticum]|uniref:Histidine--tRNA ligase n=1 Tax=uncultured Desulfobacteraceae bacterium TaxID=218296 RepID=A0A484HNT6_9BACT|nr:Histidine--tRNA ligase [uncultured Desulfobacteraceae bacterium]
MIQSIRGFKDILPGETELWRHVERTASDLFEDFGFKEIRLPIMERAELFARSIGEDTDIVEKEMYSFSDRGKDLITLRPEATASIARSYIQHKMHGDGQVRKFYTIGPMFRRERPQKGRHRQFYQINAEVIGSASPLTDAGLIFMLSAFLERVMAGDVVIHLNSLGCPSCRPAFSEALKARIEPQKEALCADCRKRSEKNPLRTLDCKVPSCKEAMEGAPALTDFLCAGCQTHFDALIRRLDALGIAFVQDKKLVRGLDYYTRTTFEVHAGSLGAQNAVAGGGRYDGLIRALGGPDTPGAGFAVGFDRLAAISGLSAADCLKSPDVFIAAMGEACVEKASDLSCRFAARGIRAEADFSGRSLKSQMKLANRLGALHVMILGDDELEKGQVILRNMAAGSQVSIPLEGIVENVESALGLGKNEIR